MPSIDLFLAQSTFITVWFTPIWLLSVGVLIGFLLVLIMLGKIFLVSKIPGLNSIAENQGTRTIAAIVVGLLYTGLFVAYYYWRYRDLSDVFFPLLFVVPLSLVAGWGIWSLVSRHKAGEAISLAREGFLGWTNFVCLALSVFAIVGLVLGEYNGFGIVKFADNTREMLQSVTRLPYAREYTETYQVEPSPEDSSFEGTEIPVPFIGEETTWIRIRTDQRIEMACEPLTNQVPPGRMFELTASNDLTEFRRREDGAGRIPNRPIDSIFINNMGSNPATVTAIWKIEPVYKQVWIIPWSAVCVCCLYFFYLVFAGSFPKISAIALSTFKTEISQPLFLLVLIIGAVFMVGSIYIPYNTFGEDIKMYKDSGLTMLKVLAIFMAIWAAGKSVAEEIEGRTALTVLSKPVGRRQFILGKFSGIVLSVAILFIILGVWFVFWTSYKPIYDGGEASTGVPEWTVCFDEAMRIVPAIFLAFLEVTIFVAISVAISTRFGILANFLICFSIYVLGHLTPLIVQSSEVVQSFELIVLFSQIISIIFPVLDHFDVQAAINTSRDVPLPYLGWAVIYSVLYGAMAMLLALVLFEDRDLA